MRIGIRLPLPMFAAIVCLQAFANVANCQTSQIDRFVQAEMAAQKIPGVALAIVQEGRAPIVRAYGFADLEHRVAVTSRTVFQSGSIGKQFTAMAVMILVEEGKLGLDEKIGGYLGDIPESWRDITVRHLLSHTSGMTDYPPDFDLRRDYTEGELLEIIKKNPLAFRPGERWEYSNLGYVTLGILLGRVTGIFYGEFLRERVLGPAGMTTARVISEADIISDRASGYRLVKGEIKNQNWVSPTINTTADGSLYLSIVDMIKWDHVLSQRRLVGPGSYGAMWRAATLNSGKETSYGFGWAIRSINGRRLVEHGGAWQGFRSFISRYLDDKVSVIVLANSSDANPQRLAHGIAEIVKPSLKPIPSKNEDPKTSNELKLLFESILMGKADRSQFEPPAQRALFGREDRLLEYLKTRGKILAFRMIRAEAAENGAMTYTYEVQFGSMTIALQIVREKTGKISRLEIHPE